MFTTLAEQISMLVLANYHLVQVSGNAYILDKQIQICCNKHVQGLKVD